MTTDVFLIAGARPNFMKIAPIAAAIRDAGRLRAEIVHTEQHYDRTMSALFFEQLGIPEPSIRLGVGSGSHATQTAEVMTRLEPVLLEHRPSALVVVGDVNSTLASALVAVKLGVQVAHVEAGLRSFDRTMPEEINRLVTDAISDWLFVSERSGLENLAREGVAAEKIHFVGNVMIDTLLRFREPAARLDMPGKLGLVPGGYALVTLHRPANVDAPEALRALLGPLVDLGRRCPVIFPVHPRTAASLARSRIDLGPGIRLVEPMGYLEFLGLMQSARLVLTDSGGIQEETTVLGVPCVTLRANTERPVTVTQGTNRLAGLHPDGIRSAIDEAFEARYAPSAPELWDGAASARIADVLATSMGH